MRRSVEKLNAKRFRDAGYVKQSDVFHCVALLALPREKRAEMLTNMRTHGLPGYLTQLNMRAAKALGFVVFDPATTPSGITVQTITPGDVTIKDLTGEVSIVRITALGEELLKANPVSLD